MAGDSPRVIQEFLYVVINVVVINIPDVYRLGESASNAFENLLTI